MHFSQLIDQVAQILPLADPPLPHPPDHTISSFLYDWALSLASSHWILLVLFVFCVIDGFFPPFPSETLIIALASLSMHSHTVSIWLVVLVGTLGAFLGDIVAFHMGRAIPVEKIRWLNHGKGKKSYDRAAHALHKRGSMFIFSARFIPVGRVAVNFAAGATGFERARFLRTDIMASATWASYGALIGLSAGAALREHPIIGVVVGVVGGMIIGALMDKLVSFIHHQIVERKAKVG